MPEQFFTPIGLPGSLQGTLPPAFKPSPTFKTGYRNIYGTKVEGEYEPETSTGALNVNFPIGSHQSGLGFNARGYVRPGINGTSDYGGFIGVSKKITPEISNQEVIRAVAEETGIRPEDLNEYRQISNQVNTADKSFQEEFAKRFAKAKSRLIDEKLGIRPGAEKYSFGIGADVKNIPMETTEFNPTGVPPQTNQMPPGYNPYMPTQPSGSPSSFGQYVPPQLRGISN